MRAARCADGDRRPLALETMLRVYFPQQWLDLTDPQAEDRLYDSESMRPFARVELRADIVSARGTTTKSTKPPAP